MSQSGSEEKQRLRAMLLPQLRAVSGERSRRAGLAIAAHLERSSRWGGASELALYASGLGEVDSRPLLEAALRHRIEVLLPRMVAQETLEFVAVEGFEDLVAGRYGVREPGPERPARNLSAHAMVLVPGIAFDGRGGRLGRGAGYYDRALAPIAQGRSRPCFVGVAFDLQIVDRVPMKAHDVFMDAIVTESGAQRVQRGARPAVGEGDEFEGDQGR